MISLDVVDYAAQECAWQKSGELSVGWMLHGWAYVLEHHIHPIRIQDVVKLGRIVEPRTNMQGFRNVNVTVDGNSKRAWYNVPSAIERLLEVCPPLESITEVEAIEWYRQYEEIHPFQDGNGRTGSLLFQWLRGTIRNPVHPPDLWGKTKEEK